MDWSNKFIFRDNFAPFIQNIEVEGKSQKFIKTCGVGETFF